ncbi:MAG: recombination mediator RecR [Bacteroidia bacterium]|nr:recombination mediator RecR [Bacteroidia bacterium]MCX7651731.1 recombination mediator RecR [Bacteroidia bacterium]MDW8416960.1 recombination mediator RecR [Bacteroidia bacterium]
MELLLPPALRNLRQALEKLPGIGPRSALRIIQSLLKKPEHIHSLLSALEEVVQSVHTCPNCGFWTESEGFCDVCTDPHRDHTTLCIVKDAADVLAIERSQAFRGKYHVLGGVIDPLSGVGEKDLRLEQLWERLKKESYEELIFALGTSPEAETTTYYIARHLIDWHGRLSRFASGIPVGSELEYIDPLTLSRSLRERQPLTL